MSEGMETHRKMFVEGGKLACGEKSWPYVSADFCKEVSDAIGLRDDGIYTGVALAIESGEKGPVFHLVVEPDPLLMQEPPRVAATYAHQCPVLALAG